MNHFCMQGPFIFRSVTIYKIVENSPYIVIMTSSNHSENKRFGQINICTDHLVTNFTFYNYFNTDYSIYVLAKKS